MKKRIPVLVGIISFFYAVFLSDTNAVAADIYHIVTTVSENPANAVTVNYHCSNKTSYVLCTKAKDVAFRKAVKIEPISVLWSTQGIEKSAKETTFYTRERYVCSAAISGLEANTKYIYKIISEGVESKIHSFVTAGKKASGTLLPSPISSIRETGKPCL